MDDEAWRGKVGGLSPSEIKEFLSEGKTARLACLDHDGWPYIVPTWHEWDGKSFWVVPRLKSKWAEYLKSESRCSIVVDQMDPLIKVVAKCTATCVEEPNVGGAWVEFGNRMSTRYLGPNGPSYLVPTLNEPRWLFRLDVVKMNTWQGVDWASRYKTTKW